MRDAPDAPVAHYHTPVAHYRYRSNDTVCIAFQTTTDSGYEQILSFGIIRKIGNSTERRPF
jgi:hypothetical protein